MNIKKVKKAFKAAFLCVLVSILVGSCTCPTDSSAASLTEQIETITRYLSEPYDVMWDTINYNLSLGTLLERKQSGDVIMVDYTADNPSVISSPLYFVRGKVIQHYFNIDNSDDVDNIDIDEFFCCTVTNKNPSNGNAYPDVRNYLPSDFPDIIGYDYGIGSVYIRRKQYDDSMNYVDTRYYVLVPVNYLPFIVYSSDGSISFCLTGRWKLYINGVYNSTLNFSYSYIDFLNNSVNSAIYRNGLSFYPNDTRFFSYAVNWSTFYIDNIATNNTEFYNNYNTVLNNVFVNSPSAKPPVSSIGIPFRVNITKDNINNYNDYGLTYNNTTNNFNFDTNTFDNYFNNTIRPTLQLDFDNVFKNQPLPNVDFNTDIRYNYIDLFNTPDTSDYLPESWLDTYGQIQTHPNINIDNFLIVPTETFDSNLLVDMGTVTNAGMDLLDVFGLASPFIALAIIGVLFKFID